MTRLIWAMVLAFAVSESLGGTSVNLSPEVASEKEETKWEFSVSAATYVLKNGYDYINPSITADRDWFHAEARYNYEAIEAGSFWLGCNFSFGEKLTLEVTPMVGGVFGEIEGIAPGYTITIGYKAIELFTQGEYFFDAETSSGNFFYTWSELSCALSRWFKVGLVVDRTKALGSNFDIRRGPLVGFKYKDVDLTTYWLNPGSSDTTLIVSLTINF